MTNITTSSHSKQFGWVFLILMWIGLLAYALFSYGLTAPNLVLVNSAFFIHWQMWIWTTLFNHRPLLTFVYVAIVTWIFLSYFGWLYWGNATRTWLSLNTRWIVVMLLFAAPLILSMNALSYDVFNYIFNAKMVAVYHLNPHVSTASEFPVDTWVRFMHNIHTPAPYGYGWTAISMVPYAAGMGKFITTWMSFRMWSILSWVLLALTLRWMMGGKTTWWWWAIVLNPLLLIEVISTMHNDLWMIVPAMLSLGLLDRAKKLSGSLIITSSLLLLFSISIKLATVALIPILLILWWSRWQDKHILSQLARKFWPLAASVALFIPLLSARSQQFHPWYWLWVLCWIPLLVTSQQETFIAQLASTLGKIWQLLGIGMTLVLFFRYLPFLSLNTYAGSVLFNQKCITWIGFGMCMVISSVWIYLDIKRYNKSK